MADEDNKPVYEHKGTKVYLSPSGRFYADTKDGRVLSSSIASIKKKLDKRETFKPFKAFVIDGYHEREIKEFTVVGITKRRGYTGYRWKTDRGYEHTEVIPDTPENRKIASKLMAMNKTFEKARKKYEADESKLEKSMTVVKPEAE